ncbi:MAG: HIT domain-containing protein [Candidatus Mariimomonas ferrooxydans]
MAEEKEDGKRVVLDTEHFITCIPYAAMSPFHTWIFPKRHAATFSTITDAEVLDLALNLKTVLAKIYFGLNNPDFNYVIRSNRPKDAGSEHSHWYLSIMPRITTPAGFEVGSGMFINAVLPEESAKFLGSLKTP